LIFAYATTGRLSGTKPAQTKGRDTVSRMNTAAGYRKENRKKSIAQKQTGTRAQQASNEEKETL
jgi:hypothetical protein